MSQKLVPRLGGLGNAIKLVLGGFTTPLDIELAEQEKLWLEKIYLEMNFIRN